MKKLELLAPAGGIESLYAAVNAGANAVYLGGQEFGARKSAENFDRQALIQVIKHCHERNVSVYVTVNTLIKNSEMEDVIDFVDFLYRHDVDAVILQDYGLFNRVRHAYPDLECHASTQMTLHSTKDVVFAEGLGFNRVVVSREMSLGEIKEIKAETDLMLEVFAHGALCISYSGQCLFSSSVGGRSGNRGACAQPCRRKYKLLNREGQVMSSEADIYLMSPKDLKTFDHMDSFLPLAPLSLKIEGRMKSPEYVYGVVSAYRHAIDGQTSEEDENVLSKAFNRQYTEGHLFEAPFSKLMNYKLPSHHGTLLGKVLKCENESMTLRLMDDVAINDEMQIRLPGGSTIGGRVERLYKRRDRIKEASIGNTVTVNFKHEVEANTMVYKTYDTSYLTTLGQERLKSYPYFGISFKFKAFIGNLASLSAIDENGEEIEVFSEKPVETALKVALTEDRITEQLSKLGNDIYFLAGLQIDIESGMSMPIKEINRMRREAVNELTQRRSIRYKDRQNSKDMAPVILDQFQNTSMGETNTTKDLDQVFDFHVSDLKDLLAIRETQLKTRILLHDLDDYKKNLEERVAEGIVPVLPTTIRNQESSDIDSFIKAYVEMCNHCDKEAWIGIGHVAHVYYQDLYPQIKWIFDTTCNLINDDALSFVASNYPGDYYMASETAMADLEGMDLTKVNAGVHLFGHIPLMHSAYCVVGGATVGHNKCGACVKNSFKLEDERGRQYPLDCDIKTCHMKIISENPLSDFYYYDQLSDLGINRFKIDLRWLGPHQKKTLLKQMTNHDLIDSGRSGRSYLHKGIE